MSDVFLFQTSNDGDINDELTMTEGLETAVYLSLFGGNEEDDGKEGNPLAWWGNVNASGDDKQVSRLQNVLKGIPATTGNIKRVNEAALADLAWLDDVSVESGIPAINKVSITITVGLTEFQLSEEWVI